MKLFLSLTLLPLLFAASLPGQKIDRQALVQRHNVVVTKADTLSSLTVGNGRFAFTVDATGLQSFPIDYQKGMPLGTQSEWGWHSFINTVGYKREEALKNYHTFGADIPYLVENKTTERSKEASNWFRQNPHRLQLGNLGFEIIKKDGSLATLADIQNIRQQLNVWTGEITSNFNIENTPVNVSTVCHNTRDLIAVKVKSPLIKERRLKIRLVLPYPTGEWTDEGTNYTHDAQHTSTIESKQPQSVSIKHQLDKTTYFVDVSWKGTAAIKRKAPHCFLIEPDTSQDSFSFTAGFNPQKKASTAIDYNAAKISSQNGWKQFWTSGGAIDFAGSTDKRAFELERRIILSQYLLRAQEAGDFPPQETGLTYNSWYGKPHLEMHWWHAAHYPLWGRDPLLERSMDWYKEVAPKAKAIAQRQGFEGIRWPKMTDNTGDETPSSIGALLIWEQPHFIYFAEELYKNQPGAHTLNKYKDLVFKTAEFMASYPFYDSVSHRYILGKGVIPAQERFKAEETYNPTFELVYWHWALSTAQKWRERSGLQRDKKWDEVLRHLSSLPVQNDKYLFTESATDSYTNPEFRTDHPAVLGALGMMPATGQVDTTIMHNTFGWIWNNWTWSHTWGWDFPLTAMAATRLGMPEKAIDALLMDIQTNTYLPNGHNYQDGRLRVYLPGNGGLLTAIAMMVAGYDGSKQPMPGIPKNGQWKVRWEGLKKML